MSATIAYLLVVGVLLAVAARAGEEALRLARRPTRWAWIAALALLGVLGIRAATVLPQRADTSVYRPTQAPVSAGAVSVERTPWGALTASITRMREVVAGLPRLIAPRTALDLPARVAIGLGVTWAAMSLAVLTLLFAVYWRFSVAARALPSVEVDGVRVRVSRDSGPGVIGVVDPQIIIPAWMLRANHDEQRLAVAHERQHILGHDPQLLIAACVVMAVLPWHPAAWWMFARLRLAVELDCDRRVIASGVARRVYGCTLVDIAERCARLPLGVPAFADHSTYLERRLIAMSHDSMPYRPARLVAVGAAALLAIAAACEARVPASPEIETMDAAAIQRNPKALVALASDTTASYFVDGREATAAAVRALHAEDIAAITVSRTGRDEIHVVTKAEVGKVSQSPASASTGRLPAEGETGYVAAPPPPPGYRPLGVRDYPGRIIVDGKPADESTVAQLTPDRIKTYSVLKDSAARQRYPGDPKASNGAIVVETKP